MTNTIVRRGSSQPAPRQTSNQTTTIENLLKKHSHEIALALPQHVTPDRLLRIALSEIRRNPRLAKCSAASLLSSIFTCAQLGLEPGGPLGQAYLVSYGDECQFQLGYKGMIVLARNSGQIKSLSARAVYENDEFEYSYGLNENITHVPARGDRGELIYTYAVARLMDGGFQFEVMDRYELEEVRNGSQGYKAAKKYNKTDTFWIAHFDEMCRKTAIRRLFKYLPVSVEIAKAVALDEAADRGQHQSSDIDHLLLNEPEKIVAPAIAAAAAPIAALSEQQIKILETAIQRQLTPVGQAAFRIDMCGAYNCKQLSEIPADQHSTIMGWISNEIHRERWNQGCACGDSTQLLTDEEIANLSPTPQATEVAAPSNEAEGVENEDDLQGQLV